MGGVEELVQRLVRAGHGPEEIERAVAEGRIPALAVETALGGGKAEFTLSGVAKAAHLPGPFVRELMQALGRPNPGRGERAFGQEDVELARMARRFLDAGLPRGELLEVSRVLSQGMTQTANAVRRLVGNALLEAGASEDEVALRYIDAAEQLGPLMSELIASAVSGPAARRHQPRAADRGRASRGTSARQLRDGDRLRRSRRIHEPRRPLPPEDLGRIARRLAELATRPFAVRSRWSRRSATPPCSPRPRSTPLWRSSRI